MSQTHNYSTKVTWTGNLGSGTATYSSYSRDHLIQIPHKPDLLGSADAPFRGDITKYNPEDMLLTSLATCHMLWYFHLCADNGIVVVDYVDNASAVMNTHPGKFEEARLNPVVTITDGSKSELAKELHDLAHKRCFIANSVNFPVLHFPTIIVAG